MYRTGGSRGWEVQRGLLGYTAVQSGNNVTNISMESSADVSTVHTLITDEVLRAAYVS
jgi:hypothetical protein